MMNRIARLTCTTLALAGAAVSGARAGAQESKPTIVIMAFNNEAAPKDARDYAGLEKAIADFLITEMSANPGLRVVDRGQVQHAMDAQRLAAGARVTRESAAKAATALGAHKIIVGRFMPDARGNFRIDARAVDVASGTVEFTDRVQDRADNIMPLVSQLAGRLSGGLRVPAPPARDVAGPRLSMRSAIAYGQALDAADRGERARAAELYGAVLKDYPDYEPARRGLAKLKPGA